MILALLHLSGTISQIFRLPTLIHHYQEHQQQDPNSTIFDFLKAHYASTINHPDDEHKDHEKLPFKSADCSMMHVVKIIHPSSNNYELRLSEGISIKSIISQSFFYNAYLSNIWQPPRWV